MAFHASSFIFDGISCDEFNLVLYNFGDKGASDAPFTTRELFEDRLARSYKPLYYGSSFNKPLEFSLTFGLNPLVVDKHIALDRWDMQAIAAWLTGPDGYRSLIIVQDDLEVIHFKCIITDLQKISVGNEDWAFSCRVRCDSPYGYMNERVFRYNAPSLEETLYSPSTHCGYYYPKLKIVRPAANRSIETIEIVNLSDSGRVFRLASVPISVREITVDGQRGVIQNDGGENLYNNFNHNFFRLVRGKNKIKFSGKCTVDFICEFPVNVGG